MFELPLLFAVAAASPDGGRILPEQACYTMTIERDGRKTEFGRTWQSIERSSEAGRPVLRVVVHQVAKDGRFDMRDTFVLDAVTLAPLRFRNERMGQEHVSLEYRDGKVTGRKVGDEGKVEAVDVGLPGTVWEGNLFGVLFAALPLAEGAGFRVPYYQYDKGLGEFSVRVKGVEQVRTPDGPVEAWVLDAGANEQQRMEYLIGRGAQRELGYRGQGFAQALGGDCSDLAAKASGAAAAEAK